MTSEKRLREIAAQFIRDCRDGLSYEVVTEHPDELDRFHPDSHELCRVSELVESWPILDLPVPDRNGCLWPAHGRNYGYVRRTMIQPHVGDPFPGVIIARGGPGEASRHTNMTLTRAEALELAGILTAAAMEEA